MPLPIGLREQTYPSDLIMITIHRPSPYLPIQYHLYSTSMETSLSPGELPQNFLPRPNKDFTCIGLATNNFHPPFRYLFFLTFRNPNIQKTTAHLGYSRHGLALYPSFKGVKRKLPYWPPTIPSGCHTKCRAWVILHRSVYCGSDKTASLNACKEAHTPRRLTFAS